jgi:hypothetical protein
LESQITFECKDHSSPLTTGVFKECALSLQNKFSESKLHLIICDECQSNYGKEKKRGKEKLFELLKGYSVFKLHISDQTLQFEDMNIDGYEFPSTDHQKGVVLVLPLKG